MAQNGAKQHLFSGLIDPKHQSNDQKRRRFRRCQSAPRADAEIKGSSHPHPQSNISGKPHPNFKKLAIYLAVQLGVGTISFYFGRDQIKGKKTDKVLDAIYFCVVTMATVGYGDLVPNSATTKLLACAYVFTGMALVGLTLSEAADYLVEKQEILLFKALHPVQKLGPTETIKEIETNRVRYKCYIVSAFLLILMVVGTIILVTVEKFDLVDAFYCVCTSITTLGYGDKSFTTKWGRVFAIFWILTSTICLAQFFLHVAEFKSEHRQRALVKWVLTRRTTEADLEAADLDHDRVVEAAEFIIFKLKEMGKINQEDISLVMEEFENLDVDHTKTLSASDIKLAQSSQTGR
uniref:Putative two-pore potassium channel 1 isoform X3 n=1 Tax=Davidia involucrata TaxID=16924 RepID=A0A5B7B4Q1_DAVIN